MIPRAEHLKQINRFHDIVENISKKIESAKEGERFELLQQYFHLTTNTWRLVDDNIEKIKNELDKLDG